MHVTLLLADDIDDGPFLCPSRRGRVLVHVFAFGEVDVHRKASTQAAPIDAHTGEIITPGEPVRNDGPRRWVRDPASPCRYQGTWWVRPSAVAGCA